MRTRLPPLPALRAFEAAARHLSFTRAADELHVTQAAVSYQIKSLEDALGVRLFQRLTRRLRLTDEGQELLPVVSTAFDELGAVVDRIAARRSSGPLTVALRPYFAARWLSPRLSRFWRLHPEIELRLHHTHAVLDFGREDIDLAVRWGRGDWRDGEVELLLRTELVAVCSPRLLAGRPVREPADLAHHTLLNDADFDLWPQWLRAAGAEGIDPTGGPKIDDSNVRMQAAIDGQGFDVAPRGLVEEEIAAGRLVSPFAARLTDYAYYVVYPRQATENPRVCAFRDWLLAEGRAA